MVGGNEGSWCNRMMGTRVSSLHPRAHVHLKLLDQAWQSKKTRSAYREIEKKQ